MLVARTSTFPKEQYPLCNDSGAPIPNPSQYHRLVRCLIYLTITRPDITYSIHIFCQYTHDPWQDHLDATTCVLWFLKSSPGHGILLTPTTDYTFYGHCDFDWAVCLMIHHSLMGYFSMFGSSPISWKTKKQPIATRSSAKAEYRALANVASEF